MPEKRSWSYDQAVTNSLDPPKRQKTLRHNQNGALPHDQYTIAWICALYIEMAAARAMLDKIHEDLPQDANDKNTYMLGSIGPHNIVIACLPNGHYGTNNAASVLAHLLRSFTSIRKGFMVGIGGGVPSRADIRLGDVVVGTRVMQYDMGKIVDDGNIQRTANARIPDSSFGTAVSAMRTLHEEGPSRMSTILQNMTAKNPEYGYPTTPDRLFATSYRHESQLLPCSSCDQSKLLPGSTRMPNHPKVHHGAIASGNQVMKDSITRDEIAKELDIICFEMEAAGLMDNLPCLPIRGICDYADSHKSKEWQRYAAATAAACAKELIGLLPHNNRALESLYIPHSPSQDASPNRRQLLLESLRFEQIYSRKTSIKKAEFKTCRWFLKYPQYLEWLDPRNRAHRGFLWIRGKPGAGKSTIMKFIYEKMKKQNSHNHAITASFFFHARGEELEKSITGMYRSLLLQLLEGYPDLQEVLDDTDLVPRGQTRCPSLNVLKDLFHNAVSNLGERIFTCFIDALDECDEQQAMDMVHYFEDLAETCVDQGVQFRVCFSSRHYPYIRIQHGIELTLEHQQGHSEDMSNYIQKSLKVTSTALDKLRPQMLEKAAGVFLWVVLVVDILNKESRRSGLALQKRLAEVPSRLSDLFKDILTRDTDNMEDLLLSILWVLYAKRPLRPEEYYHALWSGLVQKDLVDPEMPDTGPDSSDCISSYVVASSKGLAEIPNVKRPTVQFIHESVRDFLIKDRGLQDLWPDLGFNWQCLGHERLKQCCSTYINHELVHEYVNSIEPATRSGDPSEVKKPFPFLEYASQYVLYHSDGAAQAIPQTEFLSQTSTPDWVTTINLFEKYKIRRYSPEASLVYILADKGFSELIRTWLRENPAIDIQGERYEYPLFAALINGHKDAVAALLGLESSIWEGVEIPKGFGSKKDFMEYKGRTPLTWAAQEGQMNVLKTLLRKGIGIDEIDQQDYTPLMRASEAGHHAVVSFLIKEGATVEIDNSRKAMSLSLEKGHAEIVKLLIEANADLDPDPGSLREALNTAAKKAFEPMAKYLLEEKIDVRDTECYTALCKASECGHLAIVKLLLESEVPLETPGTTSMTALSAASRYGHEAIVRFLAQQGANLETPDANGMTALSAASRYGHEEIVRFLVQQGADIESRDGSERTPLLNAIIMGSSTVMALLVEHGAAVNVVDILGKTLLHYVRNSDDVIQFIRKGLDVNAKDERGQTPLHTVSSMEVARSLIEKGADINARDNEGSTPLHLASQFSSSSSVIKVLVGNGADVHTRDSKGSTPLHLASQLSGSSSVIKVLVGNGADVHARDREGSTPLHLATRQLYVDYSAIKVLIDNGADVHARDSKRSTPLHLAADVIWMSDSVINVLIDNGADVHARDEEGSTPLHLAVNRFKEAGQAVRILIENGADVDDRNHKGDTPRGLVKKRKLRANHPLVLAIEGS